MDGTAQRRKWRVGALIIASLLAAGLLILGLSWLAGYDSRKDLDLKWVGQTDPPIAALDDLHDDTDLLCEGVPGCIQGYRGDHVNLLRFDSQERAAQFAGARSDAQMSNWIVIEYTDDTVSPSARQDLQLYLDGLWSSD